ncbi:MAG: hypothetical protein ACJ760_00545 [Thermoleophilaceae bacterium]
MRWFHSAREKLIGEWPFGRWIVIIAGVIGVAFVLRQTLTRSEDLYPAFLKGLGATGAVMAVIGIAVPMWRGREMQRAKMPGGTEIDFGAQAKATEEALGELNTRVTKQMEMVNQRLYDLETHVFKETDEQDEDGDEDVGPPAAAT